METIVILFYKNCSCPQCWFNYVTENLLETHNSSVRLLRVYGEEIEHQQYPLPWAPKPPRRSKQQYSIAELKLHPGLASIALHNRIRDPSNRHSDEIKRQHENLVARWRSGKM